MYTGTVFKIIDLLVFLTLGYFATQYYANDYIMFAMLNGLAYIYVALRKPDINTLTLIGILVIGHSIIETLNYSITLSGYQTYTVLIFVNAAFGAAIALRPVFISKFCPEFISKNKNLTLTHQDMIMTGLLTLQVLWQLCQLVEHLARHRDDIGLSSLFGDWFPLFFYNMYKTGQFGFSILTLVILYFMTFDKSKAKSKAEWMA
jgi:hypothetical protein